MKQIKNVFMILVCSCVFFAWTSPVSAQALDNTGFKLDALVKGVAVDLGEESISKATIKMTAYMKPDWQNWQDGGSYSYTYMMEYAPDTWLIVRAGFAPVLTSEDFIFIDDDSLQFKSPDGADMTISFSGLFKFKLDKDGNRKKVSFSTLGANVLDGSTADGKAIYGKAQIKGKTVADEQLPFNPFSSS